jgi:hypothetical protein
MDASERRRILDEARENLACLNLRLSRRSEIELRNPDDGDRDERPSGAQTLH